MRITKRNGSEEDFDPAKIIIAITKANDATEGNRLSKEQIQDVADFIQYKCQKLGRAVSVEEVQDMVEKQILSTGAFNVAKNYIIYRYERSLVRKANTTDNRHPDPDRVQLTRRSNRKIPTKIRRSTVYSVIIWRAKSARISHEDVSAAARYCGGA